MHERGLRSGDPHQQVPEPPGGLAWTVRPALGTDDPENFAWTFRNAPEGQTNRSTYSQENTSLEAPRCLWSAVFAAWQRGSIVARLGSAFIIFRGSSAAAGCVCEQTSTSKSMKPSYRTPFEGLILRDGRTKGSNPLRWYFWHRWTRSDHTAPVPVFTSASHPLEIAFLSRAGLPDDNGPIGFCMLPGRRKAKKTHRWARDLSADLVAIRSTPSTRRLLGGVAVPDPRYSTEPARPRQDRLCLVTLCTSAELARDSPGFQARIASEVACRETLPIADKRAPSSTQAFDELIARLVDRIDNDWRVVVHCNGGKGRSALVAAAVLIGLSDLSARAAVACVRAARPGSLRNPLQLWFLWSFARRWKSASKPPIPNPSDMFLSKRASDSYVRCLASNTS